MLIHRDSESVTWGLIIEHRENTKKNRLMSGSAARSPPGFCYRGRGALPRRCIPCLEVIVLCVAVSIPFLPSHSLPFFFLFLSLQFRYYLMQLVFVSNFFLFLYQQSWKLSGISSLFSVVSRVSNK